MFMKGTVRDNPCLRQKRTNIFRAKAFLKETAFKSALWQAVVLGEGAGCVHFRLQLPVQCRTRQLLQLPLAVAFFRKLSAEFDQPADFAAFGKRKGPLQKPVIRHSVFCPLAPRRILMRRGKIGTEKFISRITNRFSVNRGLRSKQKEPRPWGTEALSRRT